VSAATAAAAAILARWRAGFRFAPPVGPEGAAWPPGWRPAPWQPAYRMSPAQAAVLALAKANAIALQHKAGPLSKKRRFTDGG
jgi:hypothetical protein